MCGRLALCRNLRRVQVDVAQCHEGDALGEHQWHEQVIVASHLADEYERAQRHVRDAPVERAHADQRERAGSIRGSCSKHAQTRQRRRRTAADRQRRREVARAAPRAYGERGRDDLFRARGGKSSTAWSSRGEPSDVRNRDLDCAVPTPKQPQSLTGS